MPADTNPAGDIFGGWIMASMDAAAVMTTTRLAAAQTVTVAVSNMVFLQPVKVGDTVCFYADVKRIGRTSIALDVEVWGLRHGCGQRIKVTQAEFTFVVVGKDGLHDRSRRTRQWGWQSGHNIDRHCLAAHLGVS
jgi:acyl-CoA thioesterase YciA